MPMPSKRPASVPEVSENEVRNKTATERQREIEATMDEVRNKTASERQREIADTMNEVIGRPHDLDHVEDIDPTFDQEPSVASDSPSQNSTASDLRYGSKRGKHSNPRWLAATLLLSIVEVIWTIAICAEGLLSSKPFPVHIVGMVFATLFWNFGSAVGGLRRAHALVQLCAGSAAIIGYIGIFIAHNGGRELPAILAPKNSTKGGEHPDHHQHEHRLALTNFAEFQDKPFQAQLHIVIGYAVLFWSVVQTCSGFLKVIVGRPVLKFHGRTGRAHCIFSSAQVVLGMFLTKFELVSKVAISALIIVVAIPCLFMRWHKPEHRSLQSLD